MTHHDPDPENRSVCRHCAGKGSLPGPIHYQGYGDSMVTFCRSCPRGQRLLAQWKERPEQRAYARRLREQKAARAREESCLGKAFAEVRLSSLVEQPGARYECARYVRHWPSLSAFGRGLYFFGAVGSGKTHAAAVLANELLEAHLVELLFLSVPEFAGQLRDALDNTKDSNGATLLRRMKAVELLVLDDLGLETPSAWVGEQLYRVVDARWRERRPIVATSHLDLSALARRYPPQLASRVAGMCKAVRLIGKDRRARKLPG